MIHTHLLSISKFQSEVEDCFAESESGYLNFKQAAQGEGFPCGSRPPALSQLVLAPNSREA